MRKRLLGMAAMEDISSCAVRPPSKWTVATAWSSMVVWCQSFLRKSPVTDSIGKGMSLAIADYEGDGFPDVYVTNDTMPNFLFHNLRNGRFEEVAFGAGAALPDDGRTISGMGTDFRDYDNDGRPDIVLAALAGETFPLFRNEGKNGFRDWTYRSRIGPLTHQLSGWSLGLFDLNNDGWKDLFTANSHVNDTVERFEAAKYKLANSIFTNDGDGTFRDVSKDAGADFQTARVHRGAAFADFNQDGKLDVVVSAIGEPAELWENISPEANTWLILKLRGMRSNRDGMGARIRIGNQHNHMTANVGYASSSHSGVHFGLGKARQVGRIEIRWPSGMEQVLTNVSVNQILQVTEPSK